MLFLSEFEQGHHAFLLSNNITIFSIYTQLMQIWTIFLE